MLSLNSNDERIAAVLHDVVEDSAWTLDQLLQERFSKTVIQAVDSVTSRPVEDYDALIQRALKNPIGRRVKLAGLKDNCDLSCIESPTERDYRRI